VYRRWSTPANLAVEAAWEARSDVQTPDTGDFVEDLIEALRQIGDRLIGTREGNIFTGLVAEAVYDPELAAVWRKQYIGPHRQMFRTIIDRAIESDQLPDGTDIEIVLDMLAGAVPYYMMVRGRPTPFNMAERVVRQLLGVRVPRESNGAGS
jgi:hypothetical protein